jgi:hypothetical protein
MNLTAFIEVCKEGKMVDTAILRERTTLDPTQKKDKRSRIYVLLSVIPGSVEYAVELIRDIPGVTTVDALEGDPNLLLMIEAKDRLQLADCLIKALSAPGDIIEDLDLLIPSEQCYT